MNIKEVLFYDWCKKCKNENTNESDDPCNECLIQGWNFDSHKPIMFKQKDDNK